jgi:hypothetical protein
MGRIPLFVYDDVPWIPYPNSNISIETFGFAVRYSEDGVDTCNKTMYALKTMTDHEYRQRLQHLLNIRQHYTYHGLMRQIALFLNDPFGPDGGHLQCTYHPFMFQCCGR